MQPFFLADRPYPIGWNVHTWEIRSANMLKYFDKLQYALHDAHAKEVARQFWIKLGYGYIESPDEYGVDISVKGKRRKFSCELK